MKTFVAALTTAMALSMPAMAETSAAELFAMSNASAAETLVRETSMGDITALRMRSSLATATALLKWPLRLLRLQVAEPI